MHKKRKIVINARLGGFSLSDDALLEYNKRAEALGKATYDFARDIPRDSKILISIIENNTPEFYNTEYSSLKIVKIPFYIKWRISEYDGLEYVAEVHRTWS